MEMLHIEGAVSEGYERHFRQKGDDKNIFYMQIWSCIEFISTITSLKNMPLLIFLYFWI
jgi:hypothetical protein